MILVAGHIDFHDRAARDLAVERSVPLQQATRDDEPGCIAYSFSADPCVDTRVQVHEVWEDQATLAAHFVHENYFSMLSALGEIGIARAVTNKYRCDRSEPVYDETGTASAAFSSAT